MHIMKEKKPLKQTSQKPTGAKSAKSPSLNEEDAALWGQVTQDVTQLGASNRVGRAAPPRIKRPSLDKISGQITLESFVPSIVVYQESSFQLDGNLRKRFEKGEVPIDGKIDLHGLTLPQAHQKFMGFVARNIQEGARCLLVVTGKGSQESENGRGVIRKNLPLWCEDAVLKPHILQVTPAQPKHGGSGACYIMLRKRR